MAVWTNNGLNLAALSGVQSSIAYVGISPGCGTLASPITSGVAVTSLGLNAGLPANLAGGQSLTITDGTNSETVTVAGGGALAAATSIPINSWTPINSYAATTTGVCPTPAATDTMLYGESQRVAANPGVAGANPGESLNAGYFDSTQPTAIYLLVGYFGGATATGTVGTGTLLIEDIQFWNHTVNTDTNMYQADSTI